MADSSFMSRKVIVPETMSREEMLQERWKYEDLVLNLRTNKAATLQWLARRNLIRNSVRCQGCKIAALLYQTARSIDGYGWRCYNCSRTKSVREGSFFSNSRLEFRTTIYFVYLWVRDCPQKLCALEAAMNKNTVVGWASSCREICERWLEDSREEVGGLDENGQPKVVEIDESKFFHRKYRQGLWEDGHWVFGGIEKGTGKCFLAEVPDRTEGTLTKIIRQFILPGTVIVSGGWRGYGDLAAINGGIYEHDIIPFHTQNTESLWNRSERKIKRQFGVPETVFPSYHHEFLWKNWANHDSADAFSNFLVCIWHSHPFN